jgi:large subunit ribosomal protein L33
MAKKAGKETVALVCTVCKSQNYITVRNKINIDGKLELKKYCKSCRKHQPHKETTKLK